MSKRTRTDTNQSVTHHSGAHVDSTTTTTTAALKATFPAAVIRLFSETETAYRRHFWKVYKLQKRVDILGKAVESGMHPASFKDTRRIQTRERQPHEPPSGWEQKAEAAKEACSRALAEAAHGELKDELKAEQDSLSNHLLVPTKSWMAMPTIPGSHNL